MSTSAPARPRPVLGSAGDRLRSLARGRPGDPSWVRPATARAGFGPGGGGFGRGGSSQLSTRVQQHGTAVDGVSTNAGTLFEVSA